MKQTVVAIRIADAELARAAEHVLDVLLEFNSPSGSGHVGQLRVCHLPPA